MATASSSPVELADLARAGDRRALARLLTAFEEKRPGWDTAATHLRPWAGRAHVVGVTGPPGAGKSTLVDGLIGLLRRSGRSVAVIAVDPSSPLTGGALLGDRIRMQDHIDDPGVFIRSTATRGHLGGLAEATAELARVLDAVGFDVVLVETVGAGQSEVEVCRQVDTTVVVLNPGWGDDVQAEKAGLLEVADIFVINKADREGADQTEGHLRAMLELGGSHQPPVLRSVATTRSGVAELLAAIDHDRWLHREYGGSMPVDPAHR